MKKIAKRIIVILAIVIPFIYGVFGWWNKYDKLISNGNYTYSKVTKVVGYSVYHEFEVGGKKFTGNQDYKDSVKVGHYIEKGIGNKYLLLYVPNDPEVHYIDFHHKINGISDLDSFKKIPTKNVLKYWGDL